MISLVGSATGIIATWAALYISLTGLGLATHHWSTGSRPRGIGDSAWVGYACVLLALQLWHLFLPLGAIATVLVVGGGGAAALAYRDAWTGKMWTPGWGARLVAGIVIAWIAVRALGEMTLFDSGMYHVPFVNWAKAYPIVPGLANLHGRLGFNPASLLFAAMVDVGPWVNGSQHVVNGFLVALYALQALRNAATLRPDSPASPRALFELAMLPGVLVAAMRQDVRSLSTDLPAFVLLTVAGGMLLVFIATAACGACLGALPLRRVPATDLLRGGE